MYTPLNYYTSLPPHRQIDFGHVPIPKGLRPPAPAMGGALDAPGLSARYVMRSDTKYFTIVDFTYDGRYEGERLLLFDFTDNFPFVSISLNKN